MSTLALMTLIAGAAMVWVFRPAPSAPEMRLEINTPPTNVPASLAIAPDGQTIAFVANDEKQSRLWLRALDSTEARPLTGADGAQNPFWSPDSRSLGFFADNKLKRIDIDGGSVRTLAKVYRGTGGAWNRDGVILFSSLGDPISRVSATTGGEPVALSGLFQQGSNFTPRFLPDGRRFLYYVRGSREARGVYVGQIDGALETRRLLDADSGAVYAPSGHLLFVREGTLFAQHFDPVRLSLSGNPFPVAESAASCACLGLSVSDTGSIAYRTNVGVFHRQFVWFDRSGNEISKLGDSGIMGSPSLSLDGQRIVGYRGNPVDGNIDVWVLDRRGVFSRFTTDAADDVSPVWSPDGDRIVFVSNRRGSIHDLYVKSATAGGSEKLLLQTADQKTTSDWSPDGRFVLFDSQSPKSSDIWAVPLDGTGKPFPVAQTNFDETRGQFSPDGHWIAYQSDESGRDEIYVQPFPGPGNKWPISTNGGSQVRWRRDGKELFYVALDDRLMAVPIRIASNGQAPEVGAPVALFAPPLGGAVQQADFRHQYVVSADGQRFLVATVTPGPTSPIPVILNWKPRQ
jgi:Tol biopolymer transport system component